MLAALCHAFGPPEDITVEDVPVPAIADDEVLVKVEAAGVNFADGLMTAGRYQVRPQCPFIPGLELSGTVADVAADVTSWRVGDRVMGAPAQGGGFAEYIAMPANRLFRVPPEMSFELASGFLVGHGTAGFALSYRGGLRAGEWVVITGAGGGVGIAAVDVAKRMGARVIAAAGSAEKLAIARAHGADALVNYSSEDLRESLKALTGGHGVDIVFDVVGGAPFEAALRATAAWARVLIVGFASGELPRIRAEYLLVKNLSVLGAGFGGAIAYQPEIAQRTIDDLLALHRVTPFQAEIADELGLHGIPQALRRLAERAVAGKLIMKPSLTADQTGSPLRSQSGPQTPQ